MHHHDKTNTAIDMLLEELHIPGGTTDADRRVELRNNLVLVHEAFDDLQVTCHQLARKSGWWDEYDAMPEQYRKYFIGTKLALVHSEASEALEGVRKNLMDDHLPHRPMGEVEAADVIIRLLDMAGALGWNVAGAVIEKLAYNQKRPDHKPEVRNAAGGKQL